MAGRPQKAAGRRVGHRGRGDGPQVFALPPASPPEDLDDAERCGSLHIAGGGEPCRFAKGCARPMVPRPPAGVFLLKRSKDIWLRFWCSEAAIFIDAGKLYRVERWIRDVDELERAWREYRRERVVAGSTGQNVLNKMWRVIQDCESRLRAADAELGLTPAGFARLEALAGDAALKREELNRRMNQPDEPPRPRVVSSSEPIEGEWTSLEAL